ncbi:MAG: hypothetical protein GVY35_14670 [Bacteroidetes bacterium]|jgi:hypothetical protein|nr:hypothetical protein [Bacteroidota bacterium]
MLLSAVLRAGLILALLTPCAPAAPFSSAAASGPLAPANDAAVPDSVLADSAVADPAEPSVSLGAPKTGIETLFEFFVLGLFVVFLVVGVGAFIGGFAAVSIFMETGCLRLIVFGLGWIPACFVGFLVGVVLSEATGWWLLGAGFCGGFVGYPIGWVWGRQRANQLPREAYLTWKHTLTGGALLGTGAGSALSLARSAALLFKGGGGSFGGGGASGSFGGAQAAAAQGAAMKGATAPGALAVGTASSASSPEDDVSTKQRVAEAFGSMDAWLDAAVRWFRRFRWYHGVAFVLVGFIFLPVGMGISAILQNGNFLLGLVLVGLSLWAFVAFITTERFGPLRGSGVIVLMPLIAASVWLAAHSNAPYWHLGGVLAVAGAVAFYRSRKRRTMSAAPPTDRSSDAGSLFQGGSTSATWT